MATIDDLLKDYPHLDKQKLLDEFAKRGIVITEDGQAVMLDKAHNQSRST